ncbi:MAG TPA: hypothetical protein VMW47_03750 [Verrucomicrobiae bacterium]|nr:hypothetical protein [Verrucomicrobiae bacterium]
MPSPPSLRRSRGRARAAAALAALLLMLVAAGCAGPPPRSSPRPASTPAPTPALPFGILPLGGVAPLPLRLAGPYRAAGPLTAAPATLLVARVPFNPVTAVGDFARGLGLVGPPRAIGAGLAYNLGGTRGFQLTTTAGLTFSIHPNHPVEEIGATPTLEQADRVARAFFGAHHLLSGGGLELLASITRVNGSDRRITFALTLGGRPVVDITGAQALIEVDVATDGSGVMAVVGAGGRLPYPAVGRPAPYRTWAPAQVLGALAAGRVNPAAYRLRADLTPFPAPRLPAEAGHPARLRGDRIAVVVAAGFAVPVYVFRVYGRPGVPRMVTCALPPTECLPLRYGRPGAG